MSPTSVAASFWSSMLSALLNTAFILSSASMSAKSPYPMPISPRFLARFISTVPVFRCCILFSIPAIAPIRPFALAPAIFAAVFHFDSASVDTPIDLAALSSDCATFPAIFAAPTRAAPAAVNPAISLFPDCSSFASSCRPLSKLALSTTAFTE